MPPSAMMTPARMKSGTAMMGVESEPENVFVMIMLMELLKGLCRMSGATVLRIMLIAIGMPTTRATANTRNTMAAITCLLLLS